VSKKTGEVFLKARADSVTAWLQIQEFWRSGIGTVDLLIHTAAL